MTKNCNRCLDLARHDKKSEKAVILGKPSGKADYLRRQESIAPQAVLIIQTVDPHLRGDDG